MEHELARFHANDNDNGDALPINKPALLTRFLLLSVEPWREYCRFRPNDMPSKGGSPAALAKLAADPTYGFEEVPSPPL